MSRKDYRALDPALSEQGWEVELTSNGHVKATPPGKEQQIVHYSKSSDPRAFKNTLQNLRRSGFVWPWPTESYRVSDGEEAEEEQEEVEVEQAAEAQVTDLPVLDPDRLYYELKEARTYAALAKEALEESKRKFEEAQKALRGSEEEYELAIEQMKTCKHLFDTAFHEEKL